jgi:hypothetical protein
MHVELPVRQMDILVHTAKPSVPEPIIVLFRLGGYCKAEKLEIAKY